MKKLLFLAAASLFLSACTQTGDTALRLEPDAVTLSVGATQQLTARNAETAVAYTWSSSKSNIASVSDKGLVTALTVGTTTITIQGAGSSATCFITVRAMDETDKLTGQTSALTWTIDPAGRTFTLSGTGAPADYDSEEAMPWFAYRDRFSKATIEEGVTAIGNNFFKSHIALEQVQLPSTLTRIGENAFGQTSITSLTIPSSVTTVGPSAFRNCQALTQISLPEGITRLDVYAFTGCLSLETISLPASLTSMGESALGDCSSLSKIEFKGTGLRQFDRAVLSGAALTTFVVPEGVTRIEGMALAGCSKLTEITLPSTLNNIAFSAFTKCTELRKVTSLAILPPALSTNTNFVAEDDILYVPAEALDAYKASTEWSSLFSDIRAI